MIFDQKAFVDFIFHHKIIHVLKSPIKLKSGIHSHIYINWRTIAHDVLTLDHLTDFILSFVSEHKLQPDCFFGVPEGATKLGLITSYKFATRSQHYGPDSHFLSMGRGHPKEHGQLEDRYFIGNPSGRRVIVLEDVTTTGGSLLKSVDQLLACGADVIAALTLTNRHPNPEGLSQLFLNKCPFYSLSTLSDLLDGFVGIHEDPDLIQSILNQEFLCSHQEANYGIGI
ncbi:MAG TPA: phosphoribosyltransferase family protein [Candidatus Nitrosotenuis sp.]|jgi:orotate phosphoribosyltransferase|nr:phosphoribosyltransferase family protein [Candidatus Nitrosotenuis sp.]